MAIKLSHFALSRQSQVAVVSLSFFFRIYDYIRSLLTLMHITMWLPPTLSPPRFIHSFISRSLL